MDGGWIPSSKPFFPKMRNAAASRPLRYSRSACLSSNTGGLGKVILTFWSAFEWPFAVILDTVVVLCMLMVVEVVVMKISSYTPDI